MSVILMTTLFCKALILQGEIWCWSLLGLKGLTDLTYALINSKLQHPPRANPGHMTITCARGVGNLTIGQVGWGIWIRNVKFNFKFYLFGWSGSDNMVRYIVAIFFLVWRGKVKKQLFQRNGLFGKDFKSKMYMFFKGIMYKNEMLVVQWSLFFEFPIHTTFVFWRGIWLLH